MSDSAALTSNAAEYVRRKLVAVARPARRPPPSRKVAIGIAILFGAVLVGWAASAAWNYAHATRPSTQTATAQPVRHVIDSRLSLWASRQAGNVTITWDSQRPFVKDARIGILTVTDGGVKNEFPLTPKQLQSNKLLYESRSNVLDITMEVFSATGTPIRESILLTAAKTTESTPSAPEEIVMRQRSSPERVTARRVRRFIAAPPRPSSNVPMPALVTETAPAAIAGTSLQALQTPDFLASSAAQARAIARKPDAGPTVQPATPIQQVKPALTPTVLALLKRPVTVQVKVFINAQGRVTNVEAFAPFGGMNDYLKEAAAGAARMWRFEPARRGETKLASETVLQFVFAPKR